MSTEGIRKRVMVGFRPSPHLQTNKKSNQRNIKLLMDNSLEAEVGIEKRL
jgi:hypothetical protein